MSDLALTASGRLAGQHGGEAARLHKAANQFEATFLQQLFQHLENSTCDDEPLLGGDPASKQFKSLYHSGLSEQAAGGLGIADLVFKELSARAGLPAAPTHPTGATP